jgi:hypothetical protein
MLHLPISYDLYQHGEKSETEATLVPRNLQS